MYRVLLVACALVCAAVLAQNESAPPLTIEVVAERLVVDRRPDGREYRHFVPARQVRADEEVHYTLRVRNVSSAALPDVVVIRPVPDNTAYVAGSASGPAAHVTYSTNDGATFDVPARLTVPGPDGAPRAAEPGDYTHIRWELAYPLAPGAIALLRFRVVLR
jgi:uncharacterized repeat protein (TIGR01451 family)